MDNNKEFDKWFDKQLDNENAFTSDEPICKQAWQAAQQKSACDIAESDFVIKQTTTLLAEICLILKGEPPAKVLYSYHDLPKMVLELKADNERLREALKYTLYSLEGRGIPPNVDPANLTTQFYRCKDVLREALSATPSQSLQAHDNEVIERCADICYASYRKTDDLRDLSLADSIMELKGKQ
jgi:hypothetical protein